MRSRGHGGLRHPSATWEKRRSKRLGLVAFCGMVKGSKRPSYGFVWVYVCFFSKGLLFDVHCSPRYGEGFDLQLLYIIFLESYMYISTYRYYINTCRESVHILILMYLPTQLTIHRSIYCPSTCASSLLLSPVSRILFHGLPCCQGPHTRSSVSLTSCSCWR